ncbi:hypothetical protein NW752_009307 [Fusarium irregulare]|uniref:Uncharacterized protein n=1 Tax=Fusarium irregulare TaxID=2494466 RepID=A0A9W8U6S4_9HYPO|nr:hypothetical protein NW766_008841 [Fusarium irregulare]KAJ4010127.1 hypothetical protein NW752_009307 [Fusarium irregulare]
MAPLKDLGLGQVLARALSSSTLSQPPTLVSRQTVETVTVTADNGNDAQTLSGGAIAGIVIGSIAGFLLLLWVIRSCLNLGAPPQEREKWYHYKEEPKRHHHHRSRSRRSHRSSISAPPPIVVRDSRSRSHHRRGRSPGYYGEDRSNRYYV